MAVPSFLNYACRFIQFREQFRADDHQSAH